MEKNKILMYYGADILHGELFTAASKQKHHLLTDVASHSINTALVCIGIAQVLKRFGVRCDPKIFVIAALTHDLGILGRKYKFNSGWECLNKHPEASVQLLYEQNKEIDPQVCQAVSSHMYPLGECHPETKEAWLLTVADKCAAVTDWFCHYSVQQLDKGELLKNKLR